jgi:hypothetical protein
MAKKQPPVIEIDTRIWMTQTQAAKELGISINALAQRILRKKVETWKIDALGITLCKRETPPK